VTRAPNTFSPPLSSATSTTTTANLFVSFTTTDHVRTMTRTERSQFPRAIAKDRHDSRTGLSTDPHHVPKGGEGKHSWGSDLHEYDHSAGADDDDDVHVPLDERVAAGAGPTASKPIPGRKLSQTLTEEEHAHARAIRASALKDG
jgi:hypothetical protein